MRPACLFTTEMKQFSSTIQIHFNRKTIDGKSIVSVISAGIGEGASIVIECTGSDEKDMLQKAESLIADGFGEA